MHKNCPGAWPTIGNFSVKSTEHGRIGNSKIYNAASLGFKVKCNRTKQETERVKRAGGECSWREARSCPARGRHPFLAWADCSSKSLGGQLYHASPFYFSKIVAVWDICVHFLNVGQKIRVQNKAKSAA